MLLIVLLVIETVCLLMWLLALLGAVPNAQTATGWLAFFAVLLLAVVVFLLGSGNLSWRPGP